MATITAYGQLNMVDTTVWYGYVSSYSSSHITITDGTHSGTYLGSFSYSSSGNVYGTLSGYQFRVNGTLMSSVSGISVDAYQAMTWINSGNAEALYQSALSGSDNINGSVYADSLRGFAGNDILNGGGGFDRLIGGLGNDTYTTDGGDTIIENAGEGTDTVRSSVTYTLGANIERLELTGISAINGTGNTLANRITGNGVANTLSGGSGSDTLVGGGGNDKLLGGAGKDVLTGGSGIDQFSFRAASESSAMASSADVITDFVRGTDKIDLSAIDAFSGGATSNDAFIWRGTSAFSSTTAGEVRYQKFDNPYASNDYTMVFIDTDGDSAVEMSIRVNGLHSFTSADFIL